MQAHSLNHTAAESCCRELPAMKQVRQGSRGDTEIFLLPQFRELGSSGRNPDCPKLDSATCLKQTHILILTKTALHEEADAS